MRRLWLLIAALLTLVFLVEGCAEEAPAAEKPYKIGVIAQLSGWAASIARPARDGIVWAVEQANNKGGINGHPIELIVYDGGSDPGTVLIVGKKLIYEDKVLAIASVGAGLEGALEALKPTCEEVGVLLQSEGATLKLLEAPARWTFVLSPHQPWVTANFYAFCKERGLTRIGLLSDSIAYGKSLSELMRATASKAGLTIVAHEQFNPTDVDMMPQLMKIKSASPDVLMVSSVMLAGAIAMGQAKDMKLDVPIYALPPSIERSIIELFPEALEGVFAYIDRGDVFEVLPEDDPVRRHAEALRAGIREKYGEDMVMMHRYGYDHALILLEAIRLADPDPAKLVEARAGIRDAMETLEIAGAQRWYKYTPEDHCGLAGTFGVAIVENGWPTFLEWVDSTEYLHFPEDWTNALVGMP